MGFSQSIADLAQEYVWVAVAIDIIDGVNEGYSDFLEGTQLRGFESRVHYFTTHA